MSECGIENCQETSISFDITRKINLCLRHTFSNATNDKINELESEIEALKGRIEKFMPYLQHKCECIMYDGTEGDDECDCGLVELLENGGV